MFETCSVCGRTAIRGRRDANGVFCSPACQDFAAYPGFCPECVARTTPEGAGSMVTVNGFGTALYGSGDRCPTCHSVVARRFVTALFIPVWSTGKFRVRRDGATGYLSRRLPL